MEKLIEKIGLDKLAHKGIGGEIAAVFTIVPGVQEGAAGWQWTAWSLVGWIVVAVFEFIKEFIIDTRVDWKDIAWTMTGPALITLATVAGALLRITT